MTDAADAFQQVQSICREFRRSLKRGETQGIESYMDKVDVSAREVLFQNLLLIDVDSRHRRGETPTADEYLSRFPSFSSIVKQTFMEDLSASLDPAAASPAAMPTIVHGLADGRQLGDYELLLELGRGGFGVVYKARHQQRNELVALKILPSHVDGQSLPSSAADRLHKFRREFRSLANINHPNLIGMQTLECESNQWFFTMDLIDGVSFRDYVRPGGELNEERLRHAAKQLVEGVLALHDRGIVHRDLKPSNVLVDAGGHVTILDFGLIAELQQRTDQTASMRSAQFGGTPVYAAPEQAMGERTAASDWYALGVMLYEALTGGTPFSGANNVALVVKKQNEDAPLLSGSLDGPADLANLVDRLLQREPEKRPNASTISSTLGAGIKSSHSSVGDDDFAGPDQGPEHELIGRETQLQQLSDSLAEVIETKSPVITFVSGRSGEGKTSLAEKFLDPLRLGRDVLVLSGRCYDRESVPFKAVDTMIDAIVAFLRSRPDDDVVKYLPDDIRMLAHLFPIMRRVACIAERTDQPIQGLDDRQIRYRAFFALRDMLISISNSTPVVMFIDDLQWGDGDSATVLFELLSPPSPPAVLLLGTYRSDEAGDSPFLKEWNRLNTERSDTCQAQKIDVGPLTEDECLELVAARVGVDSEDISGQITDLFQDTRGNPYFLEQLIEGFDAATGRFRAVPLHEIIVQKLSRLPAEAAALLDVIAVAGSAASLDEISRVAGHETPLYSTVTHMRSERLVRLIGADDQQLVDTYHDKIRETTVDRLDIQKRRGLHRRIAETIEAECSRLAAAGTSEPSDATAARVFDLAHHYYEADDARAFAYQLQAGETALQAYAMENALDHLKKSAELRPESIVRTTDYRLCSARAKSLAGCQMLDEALEQFTKALALAETPTDAAECIFAKGEIYWKRAEYHEGLNHFRLAFKQLDERIPASSLGMLVSGSFSIGKFFLVPSRVAVRLERKSQADLAILAGMYSSLVWTMSHLDPAAFVFAFGRGAAVAKLVESDRIKADSYATFAGLMSFFGLHWLSKRTMAASERIEQTLDEDQRSGIFDNYMAVMMYVNGRHSEAMDFFVTAIRHLTRSDSYLQTQSHHMAWHSASFTGRRNDLLHHAKEEERIARKSSDRIMLAYAQYGQAEGYARRGETTRASTLADEAISTLESVNAAFLCVGYIQKARVCLQSANYKDARHTAKLAIRDLPKLRFCEITVPAFGLYAEAVLAADWHVSNRSITRRHLRQANWALVAAQLSGRLFPNIRPNMWRMSGRLAVAKGKARKALKCFGKAITAAEKIGAQYEHARTLIDRSMLDLPTAATDRERGLALLESLGCVLPDAEVDYLAIDRQAHHDRAAKARAEYEKTSAEASG
ncbi:MAG: protein kinase [Fuerstiella sp.]|nr:protein kinase [Fuerstiella sp.]